MTAYSLASRLRRAGLIALIACVLLPVTGQSARSQDIRVSGYIKAESAYDTRQVAQVREGQFSLYPLPKSIVSDGQIDENATNNLLFAAFQSRLRVTGVDTTAFGADLSGVIEVDFFGTTNDNVGVLRLRQAFVKFAWPTHELLIGQYWSPMFTVPVYPQVINFSTGAPFQPFARFPQIRYTYKPSHLRVIAALSQQRDAFQEIGGRKMQQQAGIPAGHFHLQYEADHFLIGAGGTMKAIRPDAAGDRFTTGAVQAYARMYYANLALRAKVTYGGDMADHLMTGGFASLDTDEYRCLRVLGTWVDVMTISKPWAIGLFAGYLSNRGMGKDPGSGSVVSLNARAPDMEYLWRLSPRVTYAMRALRIALELEATSAHYASDYTDTYRPVSGVGDDAVVNMRTLLAVYYTF